MSRSQTDQTKNNYLKFGKRVENMKIKKHGFCAICGEEKYLTFEHIPPEAAGNNSSTFMLYHKHLFDENSFLFGKKSRSHKGQGLQSICQSCNNLTGSWYVNDYVKFSNQGIEALQNVDSNNIVFGKYNIKPLNVLKQIISMFMSLNSGFLDERNSLEDFVLNKEKKNYLRITLFTCMQITLLSKDY